MRGASTSAAGAAGLVPAPAAGAATRYLRSDGTWQVPPDTNTTYNVMTGASLSSAGTAGLVPPPSAGFANRFLNAYGMWEIPAVIQKNYTLSITYAAGFKEHSSTHAPILYYMAGMIVLTGAITPTTAVSAGDTEVTMATIPAGYRPNRRYVFRQSGSGINTYLLIINTDGRITCSRYGTTAFATIPAGAWLCVSCSYFIGV